jgi:V/A-type H+-transporting ATPase subunit I
VPARDLSRLSQALDDALAGRYAVAARDPLPEERDRVPSLNRQPRWLLPFAALVRNYGVPRYGEVDPTWIFAASFVAMFGMMFGDVGQGGVIVLAGFLARKRVAPFGGFASACGLSSVLFGWAYGSVFGFEEIIHPLWISPLSDPARMLGLAVNWGIAFVLLATGLNVVNHWLLGFREEALMSGKGVAGGTFYLAAISLVSGALSGRAIHPLSWVVLLSALLAIGVHEWRHVHAPRGERAVVTAIGLFETALAYAANTLSFLRVAAFALNHVALSLAVFAIAKSFDIAGHWIAIVLGNLVIIVLEGGIVAVQTIRLEYYEGFSRYFAGDGRPFEPLVIGRRTA